VLPDGNVRIYTTAGKVTYSLDPKRVKFVADGNREGVQPGVLVQEGDQTVAWISAQAHVMVLVDDHRLISVEAAAPPSED
jgi:hypothetical protein